MKQVDVGHGMAALVDDRDYPAVASFRWHAQRTHGTVYAATTGPRPGIRRADGSYVGGRKFYMHRLIMQPSDGYEIDHINGNGLDNRRANLRAVTHAENLQNQAPRKDAEKSSRYRGVSYDKNRRMWQATIYADGRSRFIGRFLTEQEAAVAWNMAALEKWGEYARLNDV